MFDAIIIDAFIDERVPHHLYSTEFFQLVRERLTPTGCIVINVFLQHGADLSADMIAGRLAHAGFHVRVFVHPALSSAMGLSWAAPWRISAGELQETCFLGGRRSWNSRIAGNRAPSTSALQTP